MQKDKRPIFEKIDGTQYENIYVVSDIHGHYDELTPFFDNVFNKETDLLISVGDLIDRGLKNTASLALIENDWFRMVRGNHEDMAIRSVIYNDDYMRDIWTFNGGYYYYESYNDKEQEEFRKLLEKVLEKPFVIEVNLNNKKYVIAHADLYINEYQTEFFEGKTVLDLPHVYVPEFETIRNMSDYLIWSRTRINTLNRFLKDKESAAPKFLKRYNEGRFLLKGADKFIFGHTPVPMPVEYKNLLYIDTGVYKTGNIAIYHLNSESFVKGYPETINTNEGA